MMGEAKFTKGPWVADLPKESNGYWHVNRLDGIDLATLYNADPEFDAHLMAAAPCMYEMLKHLVDHDCINDSSLDKEVKNLLAKARGE